MFEDETLPIQEDPYQPLGNDDYLREAEPDPLQPIFTPTPDPILQAVPQLPPAQPPQHSTTQQQQLETQPTILPAIQQNQSTTQQQHITIELSSPTYQQQNIHLQQQNNTFGMTEEQLRRPAVRTPIRRPHRSRTPNRTTGSTLQAPAGTVQTPAFSAGADTPPLPAPTAEQTEPIEVSDGSTPDVADQAPQTPEELTQQASTHRPAGSSDTSRQRQSKRPGDPLPDETRVRDIEHHQPPDEQQAPATEQPAEAETSHSALANNNVTSTVFHNKQTAKTVVRIQHKHKSPKHCKFHRTAQQAPMQLTDDGIVLNNKHFDGTTDLYMPYASTTCFEAYRADAGYQGDGMSDDTDASQDDMSTSTTSQSSTCASSKKMNMTRQEQKALDKELPWQVIMDRGNEYIEAFIKAAQDEERSWMTFGSVDPIDPETAAKIMSTAKGRKRILKSRAAYRYISKGVGKLRA